MKPIKKLQLGKNGVTQAFVEQLKSTFTNSEIIKVELLRSACRKKEKAYEIGDKLIEALGKNFIYKLVGYILIVRKWRKPVKIAKIKTTPTRTR